MGLHEKLALADVWPLGRRCVVCVCPTLELRPGTAMAVIDCNLVTLLGVFEIVELHRG